jgi:hypothetical protein
VKIRQFHVLFTVFILFLLSSAFLIWIFPPSGEARHKRQSPPLELDFGVDGISLISQGTGELYEHQYAPFNEKRSYAIKLQQITKYVENGDTHSVRTTIKANARIQVEPKRSDRVFLSFDSFEIHVYKDDVEVDLVSVESLMAGIVLEQSFGEQMGMGRAEPLVRINPQVGRVLFLLSDMMRIIWSPLASEAVGAKAAWEFYDKSHEEKLCINASARSDVLDVDADKLELEHHYIVQRDKCTQRAKRRKMRAFDVAGEGQARATVRIHKGVVQSAAGETRYSNFIYLGDQKESRAKQELNAVYSLELIVQ